MTDMTARQAQATIKAIRVSLTKTTELITELWHGRAWLALGYAGWGELCAAEFPDVHLPQPERQATVTQLRREGMSTRAIAAATGADDRTVRRDLAGAANAAPDPQPAVVTGKDGKRYGTRLPAKAKATSAVEAIDELDDLREVLSRIEVAMAMADDIIKDLPVERIEGHERIVHHMTTIAHFVRTFDPFVTADGIDEVAARWAETA